MEGSKYLEPADLWLLEEHNLKETIRELRVRNMELYLQHLSVQRDLVSEKIKVASSNMQRLKDKQEKEREDYIKRIHELKERYGIPQDAPWGHNPDTGEIILDGDINDG